MLQSLKDRSSRLSRTRRKARKSRRLEKGDVFVLLSLIVLATILAIPFYRGGRLGSREAQSLQRLLAARQAAIDSGLVEKLRVVGESIATVKGLRPQNEAPALLRNHAAPILWRDAAYDYAIRFQGFLRDGPTLVVYPQKPGETGRSQFVWTPGGELQKQALEGIQVEGKPKDIEKWEKNAQSRASRILVILQDSGLADICLQVRNHLPAGLTSLPPGRFGCLGPRWADSNYVFRISVTMTQVGLDLDLWAWPRINGKTGFDAFFASGRSIPAQTWNMTNPYDGDRELKSLPIPGAARDRTGASLGLANNWVGWDGKRWFALDEEGS